VSCSALFFKYLREIVPKIKSTLKSKITNWVDPYNENIKKCFHQTERLYFALLVKNLCLHTMSPTAINIHVYRVQRSPYRGNGRVSRQVTPIEPRRHSHYCYRIQRYLLLLYYYNRYGRVNSGRKKLISPHHFIRRRGHLLHRIRVLLI